MARDERPNFIFIMSDQHRGDCLGSEGHPSVLTPNLDGLGESGTRFARAYSTCPSCIAARRCLLSGRTPASNGMVGYVDGIEWNPPATLPGELRQAGYQTFLVGRSMHQHPMHKRYGYDHMVLGSTYLAGDRLDEAVRRSSAYPDGIASHSLSCNGWTARPWHLDEELHPTTWVTSEAIRFLQTRDPSAPYFLTVSYYAPHPPFMPPAFYMDRYLRLNLPDPAIGGWAHAPRHPATSVDSATVRLTGEALRSCQAGYFGLINHIDDQILRILGYRGQLRDGRPTVVVYTSDHGEMLGDHYRFRKCEPYEGSARIPFLIGGCAPLGLKSRQVSDLAVGLEDVMPTLLDLAGVPIPSSVEGRSLVPILRGECPKWRPHLHGEHSPCYSTEQGHHYLTDGRMKYIWRPHNGADQLFDLRADPSELHDLAARPEHATETAAWRKRMIAHLRNRPEGFSDGRRLIAGRPYPGLVDVTRKPRRKRRG